MAGKHHDLINHTKKYKGDVHEFFLNMDTWRKFKSRYKLTWERVPFSEDSRLLIPTVPGMYVFTAELLKSKLPQHGYILYVGITGDGPSMSNLRKRYNQYKNHLLNEDGRPAVFYMLKNWGDDLVFNFVPLPDGNIDLAKLEAAFINSVAPPINRRDFTATFAAVRQSAF